ncbi:hypothetical protein COV19_05820 [Candidatus Woesearchaeota archaeon CG10_big_fil_rev_8_21_14_0_10_44_13]|nr:MAG: hypothetical protein COV19_05820 [Candidatus Woesearchaeota archaeon CG10_big_fil_rev_8_21_14_0_10_44_13]
MEDVVNKHYSGHIFKPIEVERLMGKEGGSSINYKVKGKDGPVIHLKNFLRFKCDPDRLNREIETLDRVIAVADHLVGRGIKTFTFIEAKDGRRYVREGDSQWMASIFIEGDHYKGTLPQLQQFAKELGRIDKSMQSFQNAIDSEYVEIPFKPEILRELKDLNKKAMSENPSEMDHLAQTVINEILEPMLQGIVEGVKRYSFEPGITVGNIHPHHTLYEGDDLKAVSDPEKASFGYPVIEQISFSAHRFIRQAIVYMFTCHGVEPNKEEIKRLMDGFIKGYIKENNLSAKEIEAIPLMIAKTNAHKALRILQYHYGLEIDTMGRPVEKLQSELYKFATHIREAEHFKV